MKICTSWLREWVEHRLDPEQLADRLTMLGLEVESSCQVGLHSEALVVGRVLETLRHPGADRLTLCRVDIGDSKVIGIVCGARNVRVGAAYPTALPGARLPGGLLIKTTTIRGEASAGMLCAAVELGLDADGDGLLELDPDAVPGADINGLLQLGEHVIDLNITPNRADCFSIAGVAREISASVAAAFREPDEARTTAGIRDVIPVSVDAPADCPRFAGRVIRGLDPQARTPVWMSQRLRRCGIRPIHPVVDVTNYVMLEIGQPMHGYDLGRLTGAGIRVRRARPGESLALLDGQVSRPEPDVLVIADESGPIGLAGIMGGQSTAVSATSCDIYLESAFFSPSVMAGRARRLGLHTDASLRFERGVDPTRQAYAIERATGLILAIAGGKPGPVTDLVSEQHFPSRKPIRLRQSRLARILGTQVPATDVSDILSRLNMRVRSGDDGWTITPPPARFDLAREEDLVEEVARVFGYERIPAATERIEAHLAQAGEEPDGLATLRTTLVARGFQEVITYSFVAPEMARKFGAADIPQLTLSNPISADMAVMRQSLWPGLIEVARTNLHRQQDRLRLFEIGTRFAASGTDHHEELCVAGVIAGDRFPEQWGAESVPADVFDLKSEVEALLSMHRIGADVSFGIASHPALHPGRSASIMLAGEAVGWLGEIHPALATELGVRNTALFEFPVKTALRRVHPEYHPVSKFPAVRRDLAIVVSRETPAAAVLEVVHRSAPAVLRDAFVFDIYVGSQVADTEKSVAIGLILQETSRTLTDEEADVILQKLRTALTLELRARFRE